MTTPACSIRSPRTPAERDACLDLRWRLLRQPLGFSRGSEQDEHEDNAYLLAAFTSEGTIIGTGRLHPLDHERAQIRYMAVEPGHQGHGIASALLAQLETFARQQGHTEIVLHARDTAVGFYARHDYVPGGTAPATCDLPHELMRKTLA